MKKTFIVTPIANEEATIANDIQKIMDLDLGNLHVAIVMDKYSTDRTEEIVKQLVSANGRVHLVFHEGSTGVISCYLHGFQYALLNGAEYIIEMDGGGSHSPLDIPRFIERLDQGYDCVFGSRFAVGGKMIDIPFYRRFISWGGTVLANLFLGTKLTDMTSGFEAFKRSVLENIDLQNFHSRGHIYQTEMKYYCRNYRVCEIPIVYRGSKSSFKFKSVKEAFLVLLILIGDRVLNKRISYKQKKRSNFEIQQRR